LLMLAGSVCLGPDVVAQTTQETRTYHITHRLVDEFQPMIQALLGKRGVMTLSPELRLIIVKDDLVNLASVDSLIVHYDVPLRQVKISVQLILGYMAEDSLPLPEQLGFLQTLIDEQNYKFNAYEVVDQGVILADDGATTQIGMAADQYAMSFSLVTTLEPDQATKFRQFRLVEKIRSLRGEAQRELVATEFSLKDGLTELLTAARQDNEGRTLLVFISAVLI